MSFYISCPECGANLDPGERCDCRRHTATERAAEITFPEKTSVTLSGVHRHRSETKSFI